MNWLIWIGGYLITGQLIVDLLEKLHSTIPTSKKEYFWWVSWLFVWIWICWRFIK